MANGHGKARGPFNAEGTESRRESPRAQRWPPAWLRCRSRSPFLCASVPGLKTENPPCGGLSEASTLLLIVSIHMFIEIASGLLAVMPSCLCKKAEGAVFPAFVEAVEDSVDDALDAGFIDEADHGTRATPHFHETAFDDVGGAQCPPQVPRKFEEAQQVSQISLESAHQGRISFAPARLKGAKRLHRGMAIGC